MNSSSSGAVPGPSRPPRRLILGSTSRYRSELLARLRYPFETAAPQVDERVRAGESPRDMACRLAREKAHAVATSFPDAVVIGSDQVADLNGEPLGKPGTHERATVQLRQMRGQLVQFHTAVAVVCLAGEYEDALLSSVNVHFRELSNDEIEHYLRLEQPYDCAGSAKSEALGIALVRSIESDDPTALIGLPLIHTCTLLRAAGIDLLSGRA
jgi:septum formation protein